MGRDKIHPAEHDSSTFYRFQGSQTPSRKGGTLAQAIQSRVSALFPDTFSDGKRRLSNIWQIKRGEKVAGRVFDTWRRNFATVSRQVAR